MGPKGQTRHGEEGGGVYPNALLFKYLGFSAGLEGKMYIYIYIYGAILGTGTLMSYHIENERPEIESA